MGHEATVRSIPAAQIYRVETLQMLKRIVFVILFSLALAFLISQKQSFIQIIDHPISQVNVSGHFTNLSDRDIQEKLSSVIGTGFLVADLDALKAEVELLPWVYRTTVTRVWPGEIQLAIEEQVAVSYWNQVSFVNSEGVVFTPSSISQSLALPLLVGLSENSSAKRVEMLGTLDYLQQQMKVFGLSVNELELKPRGVWELTFKNGISVALGEFDEKSKSGLQALDSKLERVGKVFSTGAGLEINNIERIDARYPNGVAIKWKEMALLDSTKSYRK